MIPPSLLTVSTLRIEYRLVDRGGPLVVFSNGAGRGYEDWDAVVGLLGDGCSTLRWNRPGVGQSDPPDRPQTCAVSAGLLAGLLETVADRTAGRRLVMVGHSLGGSIVEKLLESPGSGIAACVLVEPTTAEGVEYVLGHGMYDAQGTLGEADHARESMGELRGTGPVEPVPIVIIAGTKELDQSDYLYGYRSFRLGELERYALRFGDARVVRAPASLHFPQLTEPALVADEIRRMTGMPSPAAAPPGG